MSKNKRTPELINNIIEKHKNGEFSRNVARDLKIGETLLRKIYLKQNLFWTPNPHKIYQIDENYFQNIDTELKAYFLGFIYADGHVSEDGFFVIQIQERDEEILIKLKDELQFTGAIKYRTIKDKKYPFLRVWSKKITNDLFNHGLSSNKTLNPLIPKINLNLFNHFLRGFIDGDGDNLYKTN